MRASYRPLVLAVMLALLCGTTVTAQTNPVIHVGLAPFEGQAGPYYAQDLGLFKAAGLDVEIQPFNGGSAVVAAIASGSLQIGGGTPLPLAQARTRGIKIVLIAPGYIYDYKAPSLINALVVGVNSPIHDAKDLAGKTVGVTQVRGLDEIAVDAWLDKNGGDSKNVKYTELPQSAMADAVAAGRVEAAQMGDPGLTAAIEAGKVKVLAKDYDAISNRLFGSVWFASEDWAKQNPEVVRKFAAAINEAAAWATKNPVAAAAVLRKYLKVSYDRAHEYHARSLDVDMIQPMLDAAYKYKLLTAPVSAKSLSLRVDIMELLNAPAPGLKAGRRQNLPLNITFADYDRTRAISDGTVKLDGIDPTYTLNIGAEFCLRPVYEEYDVAEMSFSWYIMARDRGEPVRALPIFPLRMPPLSHIYVRTDSAYHVPSDLKGCRVASEAYRLTVNLWLRGICSDIYGLKPQDVEWFSSLEEEGAGFVAPDGVRLTLNAGDPEELLLNGHVDALFMPNAPDAFTSGDPRIRRLFADHESEGEAFYRTMGCIPMTHVLVASESLLAREPGIVGSLLDAFRASQVRVDAAYRRPKFLSIPGALEALERQRRFLTSVGTTTMYTHGLAGNEHAIGTFVRYGYEQGYTQRLLSVDELFARV